MKLALLIANRGFFPSSVIESAYEEMGASFAAAGVEALTIDQDAVKYGAVETLTEGLAYAKFLAVHRGDYDGLVICLPNFGDENGIKGAIADVDVPILLQAYPDELDKMDFEHRRDAFCGKLALTSVLTQMGMKYTVFPPFTVHPSSSAFAKQLTDFAAVCRVVKRMRRMRLGAIGARTTAFKSVRYDECALERHGIDVETHDLTTVFARMKEFSESDKVVKEWLEQLHSVADFKAAPEGRDVTLARFAAALRVIIDDGALDAVAVRCWSELQQELGIAPCAVMGLFNHAGIPAVCEMDVTNAIPMLGLSLAAGRPAGCLDWNNNYGDDDGKCILFHCGPLPMELMEGPGVVQQHKMLSKSYGDGCSWGLNVGKMKSGPITYAGGRTDAGTVQFYVDTGRLTGDPVAESFFGVSGVLETPELQHKLGVISAGGFRHHVVLTTGDVEMAVAEAFTKYLGYERVKL